MSFYAILTILACGLSYAQSPRASDWDCSDNYSHEALKLPRNNLKNTAKNYFAPAQPPMWWMAGELTAWHNNMQSSWRMAQALGYNAVCNYRFEDEPRTYLKNIYFFQCDPHKAVHPNIDIELDEDELERLRKLYPYSLGEYPELPRAVNEWELPVMKEKHPDLYEAFKRSFERNKAWANTSEEFPKNLAMLESWGPAHTAKSWEPCPDFQQQRVIDETIENFVSYIKNQMERKEDKFFFKGIIVDVCEIWREFDWNSIRKLPGNPATNRSALLHDGISHEYKTLREGWLQYLAQLRDRLDREFPGRDIKFIMEPAPIYDSWVKAIEEADEASLSDEIKRKARGDVLLQEIPALEFLMDKRLEENGAWGYEQLGSCTADLFSANPNYRLLKKYFGQCAMRGSWFMTFATIDRTRRDLNAYEPQVKLIRALSAWEYLNKTPLAKRVWDEEKQIYISSTSYADSGVLASKHPRNRKLYAVFLNENAELRMNSGLRLANAKLLNDFMEPVEASEAPVEQDAKGIVRPRGARKFPFAFCADITGNQNKNLFILPKGMRLEKRMAKEDLLGVDLMNLGFEEGFDGWFTGGETLCADIVEEGAKEGSRALKMRNRKEIWHCPHQSATTFFAKGRSGKYKMSAYVKTADGRKGELVLGAGGNFDAKSKHLQSEKFSIGAKWKKVEYVFDINFKEKVSEAYIRIMRVDSLDGYFVDDVKVEKVK